MAKVTAYYISAYKKRETAKAVLMQINRMRFMSKSLLHGDVEVNPCQYGNGGTYIDSLESVLIWVPKTSILYFRKAPSCGTYFYISNWAFENCLRDKMDKYCKFYKCEFDTWAKSETKVN